MRCFQLLARVGYCNRNTPNPQYSLLLTSGGKWNMKQNPSYLHESPNFHRVTIWLLGCATHTHTHTYTHIHTHIHTHTLHTHTHHIHYTYTHTTYIHTHTHTTHTHWVYSGAPPPSHHFVEFKKFWYNCKSLSLRIDCCDARSFCSAQI